MGKGRKRRETGTREREKEKGGLYFLSTGFGSHWKLSIFSLNSNVWFFPFQIVSLLLCTFVPEKFKNFFFLIL